MEALELRDEHFQILDQPLLSSGTERFLLYVTGTFLVLEQEEPYEFLLVTTRVIQEGGSREQEIELGKMWIRNKWDFTLNRGKWVGKSNYEFEVGREKKKFTIDAARLNEVTINTEPKIDVEERLKENQN